MFTHQREVTGFANIVLSDHKYTWFCNITTLHTTVLLSRHVMKRISSFVR